MHTKKDIHYSKQFIIGMIAISLLSFSSCNKFIKSVYGINEVGSISISFLDSFITHDVVFSQYDNYYLNSSYYSLISDSIQDEKYFNYALQPMQAMYFNKEDVLVSYHVNCNAGGFPNLKWNRDDNFGVFPPKTQTEIGGCLSKKSIESSLNPFKIISTKHDSFDYTIYILWSYQMLEQSKRLIEFVANNLDQYKMTEKVKIAFINMDVLYKEVR